MRQFIILALALTVSFSALLATNPSEGQLLSVIAPSGLSLRSAPGTESKVLDIIEMGEQVLILNSSEVTSIEDRIEWTNGKWILVRYNDIEGYVFDGYLTSLPIPTDNYELSYSLDLVDAMEAYMDIHKHLTSEPDTILRSDGLAKVIYTFANGEKMVNSNHENFYKVDVYMNDIRIMDAYNLLQSMLVSKVDRQEFVNESVYIEERTGDLSRIKINTDNSIIIDKMPNGQIKISMYSPYSGCSL